METKTLYRVPLGVSTLNVNILAKTWSGVPPLPRWPLGGARGSVSPAVHLALPAPLRAGCP